MLKTFTIVLLATAMFVGLAGAKGAKPKVAPKRRRPGNGAANQGHMPLWSGKNDEGNVLPHLHKYVHAIARTIS